MNDNADMHGAAYRINLKKPTIYKNLAAHALLSQGAAMAGLSPTQRTIRELKNQGRLCGIVERFISNSNLGHGIRSDLFHIFDIVALDTARGIIGVQTCGSDFASHFRKITEEYGENGIEWIQCGGIIELWSWRKVAYKRGGKLKIWKPRIKEITLDDFGRTDQETDARDRQTPVRDTTGHRADVQMPSQPSLSAS